ncbi:MAG: macro domain-containing protein, partial [Boseongicola sp.]|nr:macro domain-containing protein [Boseongicola sp.]
TGQAKITGGHNLAARFVVHTVGPIWRGGDQDEETLLRSCYVNSLRLADEHGCASIAFPAISTGVYGFPADRAARVALRAVWSTHLDCKLVSFDAAMGRHLQDALQHVTTDAD